MKQRSMGYARLSLRRVSVEDTLGLILLRIVSGMNLRLSATNLELNWQLCSD